MEDSFNKVLSNALLVKKDNLNNIKSIIKKYKESIMESKDLIKEACVIDKKNLNGFIVDFEIIEKIFSNLEKENLYFGDVTLSKKNEKEKIIYGKQVMDKGNVFVFYDGNPYVTIEMIVRNLMAGNTTILINDGFMYGTNQLLIKTIQNVFEQFNINEYLIQIYVTDKYEEILNNYANIDLVVCIGSKELQTKVLTVSKSKTLSSGYEYFDLYVEDDRYKDFINKILNTNLNIKLFINSQINIDYDDVMEVDDIDEAISQINFNGSGYSASIFTNNKENASKFVREVKSKTLSINTSPTIERIIDIKQEDLINEKNIIYPFNYNIINTTQINNE